MVECTHCHRTAYNDHPKHTVDGDCIYGFNADTYKKMVLCWDCMQLYYLTTNEKGENTFKLRIDE